MARKGNPISVRLEKNRSSGMGATGAIRLGLVHLSLALAGLSGTAVLRIKIPRGRCVPISSYWLVRIGCFILLGLIIRRSLVFMNAGDLMDIVRPFLLTGAESGMNPGSGGGQPSDSVIPPFVQQGESHDKDAGSPDWETFGSIQELPTLEGGQRQPAQGDVVDLETGASNSRQEGTPKPSWSLKQILGWKTKEQIALARDIEERERDLISDYQKGIVDRFSKLRRKERGFSFPVGRNKWEEATETLLRGEGSEVWKEKAVEVDKLWIDGPFYQAVKGFLINDNNKNKRRKRR